MDREADFVWPPRGYFSTVKLDTDPVSDEDFVGWSVISATTPSAEGYVVVNSGGVTGGANDKVIAAGNRANGVMHGKLASVAGGGVGGIFRQSLYSIPASTSLQPNTQWAFRFQAVAAVQPDALEDYEVWAGMGDGSVTAMADGIYFRLNKDDPNWVFVHERAGVETIFTTAVPFTAIAWHTLGWRISDDRLSVEIFEDGLETALVTPPTLTVLDDLASTCLGYKNLGPQASDQEYAVDRVRWSHPARV